MVHQPVRLILDENTAAVFNKIAKQAMNQYISIAFLIVNLFYVSLGSAFVLASSSKQEIETSRGSQWPVIVNRYNEKLGIFGGITSGYHKNGDLESALLLISATGYIAPILNSGSIASISVSYFLKESCNGHEYLPATITLNNSSPYRGMVYNSLSSDGLVYIPKQSQSETIKTKSRIKLGRGGLMVCDSSVEELEVYLAVQNSPESTGIDASYSYDSATVIIEAARNVSHNGGILSGLRSKQTTDHTDDGVIELVQEECAAACLTNVLGNGVCDAECYVESCFYDKGDCDSLAPEELHIKLSDFCSSGCETIDIGDDFCDTFCNTEACQFDGGDCDQQ